MALKWRLALACLTPAAQNYPKPFHKTKQGDNIIFNFHLTKIELFSFPSPSIGSFISRLGALQSLVRGQVVIIIVIILKIQKKKKITGFMSRKIMCSAGTALNFKALTELRNCAYQGTKFWNNLLIWVTLQSSCSYLSRNNLCKRTWNLCKAQDSKKQSCFWTS